MEPLNLFVTLYSAVFDICRYLLRTLVLGYGLRVTGRKKTDTKEDKIMFKIPLGWVCICDVNIYGQFHVSGMRL